MITPFMNLTIPVVGVTLGPEWATELNLAFDQIDAHNHTSGKGIAVPTAGINLDADLTLNQYNLTNIRSSRMVNQVSPLALPTDLVSLYAAGGNLYYNNAIGQQVQITQGAGLNAASVGGFGGDYGTSTASAFYTSATSTFTFWSNTNIPAIMDMGPIVLHPTASNVFGITLKAPTGLSNNYQFNLPLALPASTKFLTIDSSGNVGDSYDVDGVTLEVVSSTLQVKDAGVTFPKLAPSNIVIGTASGPFSTNSVGTYIQITNANVSITSSGHPIDIYLQPDLTTGGGYVGSQANMTSENGVQLVVEFAIIRDMVTVVANFQYSSLNSRLVSLGSVSIFNYSPAAVRCTDIVPAGTYVYTVGARVVSFAGSAGGSSFSATANNVQLVAKETL